MALISSLVAIASQTFPRLSSRVLASSGYVLDPAKLGDDDAFSVWTGKTAARQDRAWQPIIAAAKKGKCREDVAALYDALDSLTIPPTTLLEAGCGGGYNSEIIMSRFADLDYTGLDVSEAMIAIAEEHYPDRAFILGSSYDLPLDDSSCDVVVDGVALIHMTQWPRAVAEYARVARKSVVLHGLTLTDEVPTTLFAKYAYGQPALELVFNRSEVLACCTSSGLALTKTLGGLDYDLEQYLGIPSVSETWVLDVVS